MGFEQREYQPIQLFGVCVCGMNVCMYIIYIYIYIDLSIKLFIDL